MMTRENMTMARWIMRAVLWSVMFMLCLPLYTHAQDPGSTGEFDTTWIKKDKVPVHYKMSRNSPIVKTLNRGDSVAIELKIQDEDGEWCGIREEGHAAISGFVLCEYLEEEKFSPGKLKQPDELVNYMPELIRAAGNGDIATVRELLERGANVNTRDSELSWTPLMSAALSGNSDIVRLLIEKGARVNAQDKFSWTSLMIASRSGHIDIVRVMLDAGADINAKTSTGYTSLMAASKQGHADIVKLLLARGADVHARDQFGWRSITLAERGGHEDIVKILKRAEER
jgi:hypothetical protein